MKATPEEVATELVELTEKNPKMWDAQQRLRKVDFGRVTFNLYKNGRLDYIISDSDIPGDSIPAKHTDKLKAILQIENPLDGPICKSYVMSVLLDEIRNG